MYLTYRPTQIKDFESCFSIARNGFVFTRTRSKNDLKSLWNLVLGEGTAISAVIEDRDRPQAKRIVSFGFSLFVTDDFAHRARTKLPAYAAYQLLRLWKEGKRAFLNPSEIARHNAGGGINSLTLHYGWEKSMPMEEEMQARMKLLETFQAMHAGWKLREMLQEVHGSAEREIMEGTGLRLRRDYRESPPKPRPIAASHPYLMGVHREERALGEPEYPIARAFQYNPPRFRFSPGEKEMLALALQEETDNEIAASLHLSPWTVKKRWQGVYEKVTRKDAPLLKTGKIGAAIKKEALEVRRRRRLLDYLRHHMEEIRPTSGRKL